MGVKARDGGRGEYPRMSLQLLTEDDRELVRQARVLAARRGITLRQLVLGLLRREVGEDGGDAPVPSAAPHRVTEGSDGPRPAPADGG
jgi:hypothetical protein